MAVYKKVVHALHIVLCPNPLETKPLYINNSKVRLSGVGYVRINSASALLFSDELVLFLI